MLYLHGVPSDGADWLPFLERTGGMAPDLPGFGRSPKGADFEYSIEGYTRFLRAFADERGLERFSLVVHDWGAVGLALAQESPERIDRLVVLNAVPLLPGYRWHRIARAWRTPLIGELLMGFSTRFGTRQLLKQATPRREGMPDEMVDRIWRSFDHGTQRAILKLYRSAPPPVLEAAGARLGEIGRPSLVVWGGADPYIAPSHGEAYAEALGARLEALPDAGHWPWLDRPDAVDLVTDFLLA